MEWQHGSLQRNIRPKDIIQWQNKQISYRDEKGKTYAKLAENFAQNKEQLTAQELEETKESYLDLLKVVLWILDGVKYLRQGKENTTEEQNGTNINKTQTIFVLAYWL